MGDFPADRRPPRFARNPAVAVCAAGAGLGWRRFRGHYRRRTARSPGRGSSMQDLRAYQRAGRPRRSLAGHGQIYQGGGSAVAAAGRSPRQPHLAASAQRRRHWRRSFLIGAASQDWNRMNSYEKLRRGFEWNTPEYFNFGATIDSFATDPTRVALLWEDQDGNRARLTFADISAQSNRIANVLTGLGIKPGDPVMIVLPRISLWQCAYIGALKAGAIVIPCVSMLREKDLAYRANHAQARAIITAPESAEFAA